MSGRATIDQREGASRSMGERILIMGRTRSHSKERALSRAGENFLTRGRATPPTSEGHASEAGEAPMSRDKTASPDGQDAPYSWEKRGCHVGGPRMTMEGTGPPEGDPRFSRVGARALPRGRRRPPRR